MLRRVLVHAAFLRGTTAVLRRRKRCAMLATICLGLVVSACASPPAPSPSQGQSPTGAGGPGPARAGCTRAWGLYSDRGNVGALDSQLHTRSVIVHEYSDLSHPPTAAWLSEVRALGAVPLISLEPSDVPDPLHTIISGGADAALASWAKAIATYGSPVIIDPLTEMDVSSNPYSVGDQVDSSGVHYTNTAADIVGAFRAIHDRIVAQIGQGHALWVFNPRGTDPASAGWDQYYPGDPYVDWVALDAFNLAATVAPPQPWTSLRALLSGMGTSATGPYARMVKLAPEKPMMIAAFGSVESGGDKGQWLHEAARDLIDAQTFPAIHGAVYFDGSVGSADLHFATTPGALAAARSAFGVTSPYCMNKAQLLGVTSTGE